jgi:hypothetical protein
MRRVRGVIGKYITPGARAENKTKQVGASLVKHLLPSDIYARKRIRNIPGIRRNSL